MTAVLRLVSRRGEPSRRVRRGAVVLGALSIPAMALLLMAEVSLGIMLGLVAVLVAPLVVVTEFRRNLLRRANVDERERQRRNDAYRLSYRIIEYAVPLSALLFILNDWAGPQFDWFLVWFVAFQYVIFLPYLVFAWREPDEAGEAG